MLHCSRAEAYCFVDKDNNPIGFDELGPFQAGPKEVCIFTKDDMERAKIKASQYGWKIVSYEYTILINTDKVL